MKKKSQSLLKRRKSKYNVFFLRKIIFLKSNNKKSIQLKITKKKKKNFKKIQRINKYLFKYKIIQSLNKRKNLLKKVNIKITQNNIFGTLVDIKKNKIVYSASAGKYHLPISYKRMQDNYKTFTLKFLAVLSKFVKNFNNTVFNLITPLKYRKTIYNLIKRKIKIKNKKSKKKQNPQNLIINITPKKCFNGCRLKKRSQIIRFKQQKKFKLKKKIKLKRR